MFLTRLSRKTTPPLIYFTIKSNVFMQLSCPVSAIRKKAAAATPVIELKHPLV
jgi:hypothetical protein